MNQIQKMGDYNHRDIWSDILKGILVFCVILGHTSATPAILRYYIYSFHMPAFFFISGYYFKPENIITKFKKKVQSLLVPYMIYCIVFLLSDLIFLRINEDELKRQIIDTFSGQGSDGILWFFIALFWVEIIFMYLHRLLCRWNSLKLLGLVISVMVLVGWSVSMVMDYRSGGAKS